MLRYPTLEGGMGVGIPTKSVKDCRFIRETRRPLARSEFYFYNTFVTARGSSCQTDKSNYCIDAFNYV